MPLSRAADDADWTDEIVFRGQTTSLRVDGGWNSGEAESLVLAWLPMIDKAWPEVEANLIRSLHETYNDGWADPEEGFPELDEAAFLAKLTLSSIWVMDEEDSLSLIFNDGDLFGGHAVDIFWSDGKMYDASLIG